MMVRTDYRDAIKKIRKFIFLSTMTNQFLEYPHMAHVCSPHLGHEIPVAVLQTHHHYCHTGHVLDWSSWPDPPDHVSVHLSPPHTTACLQIYKVKYFLVTNINFNFLGKIVNVHCIVHSFSVELFVFQLSNKWSGMAMKCEMQDILSLKHSIPDSLKLVSNDTKESWTQQWAICWRFKNTSNEHIHIIHRLVQGLQSGHIHGRKLLEHEIVVELWCICSLLNEINRCKAENNII